MIWSGIICWLLFFGLLINVLIKSTLIQTIDAWGISLVQPASDLKTALLTKITFFGDPMTVGIITIGLMVLLWRQQRAADSVWFGMMQFIGYCLVILVKYSVSRLRPLHKLITVGGYSFPSGHTFSTTVLVFTLLTLIAHFCKVSWLKLFSRLIGLAWIILIMYSRVYLRAHYLTDVCGGFLLASGWWLLANAQREKFFNWLHRPIKK